jgi:hypothetical protein
MGDEQPLVGNQQRRRKLAAQTWWAMGWAAVGLGRGDDQVRSPDGRMLFCNGLGPRAASGTQWVLNRAHSQPLFTPHSPFAISSFFLTLVPAAYTRVPVYRHLRWRVTEREISPRMSGVSTLSPPHLRAGSGYE